ncbi:hypothetical protein B0I37DRAFT_449538 [Chaetomium sp. MPI-CAGE-AT-0009]|nr:hypothetical protein B0I37DRAFT_449538 [Chaetomium sp. MPI-CAGE-AT-0009]
MSSLGALTTAFTAPAACASSTGIHIVGCGDKCVYWAEGPLNAGECYPPGFDPSAGAYYYSPGVCPSGYTPACTLRRTAGQVTETIQTCCPTALGYKYHCDQSTWPWQSTLPCNVYMNDPSSTFDFPTVTSIRDGRTVITSTARTEVGIGAYGIEIRFQAGDFASSTKPTTASATTQTTSSSASDTSKDAAGSSATRPPTTDDANNSANNSANNGANNSANNSSNNSSNDPNNSSTSSGGGFSPAVSAGIGVGAAIGTLLILGLGIFFGRRSVQRRKQDAETKLQAGGIAQLPTEYNEYKSATVHQQPVGELHGMARPAELQGGNMMHELAGSEFSQGAGWGGVRGGR